MEALPLFTLFTISVEERGCFLRADPCPATPPSPSTRTTITVVLSTHHPLIPWGTHSSLPVVPLGPSPTVGTSQMGPLMSVPHQSGVTQARPMVVLPRPHTCVLRASGKAAASLDLKASQYQVAPTVAFVSGLSPHGGKMAAEHPSTIFALQMNHICFSASSLLSGKPECP